MHSGAPTMFGSKPKMPKMAKMTEAFFHHGVVALAMPYLQLQPPMGKETCTPIALNRRTWETCKGRGKLCSSSGLCHPGSPSRRAEAWAHLLPVGTCLTGRVALVPALRGRELTVSPLPAGQSELFHVLRVEAGGGSGCQGPGDPAAPEGCPAPPELSAGAGRVLC